ncbi:MAG: hypothetical protein ACKVVT_01855 [Dehalococcoidia bacterium]
MATILVEGVGNGGALVRSPNIPPAAPCYARTWTEVLHLMMELNEEVGLDIVEPLAMVEVRDTGLDHVDLERTARRVVRALRAMPRRPSAEGSDELIAGIVELEGVLLGAEARGPRPEFRGDR